MDDGSPVDVIYLDFQKAFDKVPHQRLLRKLKSHDMGNSIINWIEHWLTDRRQRVVVDGEVSSWKSVLSGVPQGSVLGPILFLLYINDLEEGVTGKILKFADDTKLFRKVKEIGDKQNLQDDMDTLVKWSEKWQMLFNFGKCKCLLHPLIIYDQQFSTKLDEMINLHFPLKVVKFNKHKHKKSKWMTHTLLREIKKRDELYRSLNSTKPETYNYTVKEAELKMKVKEVRKLKR